MKHPNSRFARFCGGLALLTIFCPLVAPAQAPDPVVPSYQLVNKISLSGDMGWDQLTLDSAAHRLYVPRGTHVTVIDTEKNTVVGDIPHTPGVHAVALAPKLGRGYISNGWENTVTIFDLKSLKEIQRVGVGENPAAILFEPSTNQVFTYNARSNDITALDAVSGMVLGTLPTGGRPHYCATDEKGTLFANIEDTNEILAIDAKGLKVRNRWPLSPLERPTGLTYDKAHRRLFAVGNNEKMAVVDTATGKLLSTPAIGKGADTVVFDPGFGVAISANGQDGTLTLVGPDARQMFNALGTVPTQTGARTMALDPKNHRLYLITGTPRKVAPGAFLPRRGPIEPDSAVILVYGAGE